MKRYILALLFLNIAVFGQPYDNEWIDFDKTYYKFKLAEDGLYRIEVEELQAAGFLTNNANSIRLYHQGEQVPIYLSSSNVLGSNDFIEFYGKRNDGQYDTDLYTNEDYQPTTLYSLFSDTASYFLVNETTGIPSRINQINNDISIVPPKEEYFNQDVTRLLNQEFFEGEPDTRIWAGVNSYLSDFGNGEGFVSTVIGETLDIDYFVETPSIFDNGENAEVEIKMVGRSNDIFILSGGFEGGDHHVHISVDNDLYVDGYYEGFSNKTFNFDLPVEKMESPFTFVNVRSVADQFNEQAYYDQLEMGNVIYANFPNSGIDKNAVAYINIKYPHSYDFNNKSSYRFFMDNSDVRYFEIENFNGGFTPVLLI